MNTRIHRRYSTAFKIQVAQAYVAGERSAKSLALEHGCSHSLVLVWARKYRSGEYSPAAERDEQILEYRAQIAALEQKVGRLSMQLERLSEGRRRR